MWLNFPMRDARPRRRIVEVLRFDSHPRNVDVLRAVALH
jgi:hypothetical protein